MESSVVGRKKRLTGQVIFNILAFAFLMIFFIGICPLVPFDGDDWYFTGAMRLPFPLWGVFNPSKVLPEIIMPLAGMFAAYIINPIIHQYVLSITISAALVTSLFIIGLLSALHFLCKKRFALTEKQAVLSELVLLLFFFLAYKQKNQTSLHGFYATDLTCVFHYTIPGLLNGIIVFLYAAFDNIYDAYRKWSNLKKGMLLIGIYLSVFSSIQISIILVSFCFVAFVYRLFTRGREDGKTMSAFLKESWLYFLPIFLFVVSLVFELFGKRAAMLSGKSGFFAISLQGIMKQFFSLVKQINLFFIFICCATVVLYVICMIKKRKDKDFRKKVSFTFLLLACLIINFAYLTLLYMKTGGAYASAVNGTWPLMFWGLILIVNCLITVLDSLPAVNPLMPLLVVCMFFVSFSLNGKFAEPFYTAKTKVKLDNYIIGEIVKADQKGLSEVTVKVPDFRKTSRYNWPIPYNMATWLQNTLYSHGIIDTRIKITFEPDPSVNDAFHMGEKSNQQDFFDLEQ